LPAQVLFGASILVYVCDHNGDLCGLCYSIPLAFGKQPNVDIRLPGSTDIHTQRNNKASMSVPERMHLNIGDEKKGKKNFNLYSKSETFDEQNPKPVPQL
jgi:hypothetical protein